MPNSFAILTTLGRLLGVALRHDLLFEIKIKVVLSKSPNRQAVGASHPTACLVLILGVWEPKGGDNYEPLRDTTKIRADV